MKFKKIINLSLATIIGLSFLGGISKAENINLKRIEGQSRYETSINVSKQIEKSDYVLIASGQGYADALIGGTLASQENAPLLLTESNKLSDGIITEIKRLNPKEVFILGGEKTISKNVEKELLSLDLPVKRLYGKDRVQTAKKVFDQRLKISTSHSGTGKKILRAGTYGWNFPDALVAGPFVGIYSSNNKNESMNLELANLSLEKRENMYRDTYHWFFGGKRINSNKTRHFTGSNRYETALSVADGFKNILNKSFDTVILVNGENYPDALSASVLSAKHNAPILLTPSKNVYKNVENFIRNNKIKNIIVVGGKNSVSENIASRYAGKIVTPPIESNTFTEARVTRVVDGDTISVSIDGKEYKLRMIGVDTPETVHPNKPVEFYGKEASDFTKQQLTDKTVYLEKDVSESDRYGRLLRYVWTSRPATNNPTDSEIINQMFNAKLVKNGYAQVYTYPPDVKHIPLFIQLQNQARSNNLGLWNQSNKPNTDDNGSDSGSSTEIISGKIHGNKNSLIYHVPGQRHYGKINLENLVIFDSEQDAINAGYRKSQI